MRFKRSIAVLLSANLWALTFGPEVASVFAAEAVSEVPAGIRLQPTPALPTPAIPLAPLQASSLSAPAALPSAAPAAAPVAAGQALQAQAGRLEAARPGEQKGVLDRSFEGSGGEEGTAAEVSIPEGQAAAPELASARPGLAADQAGPPRPSKAQKRSAFFPMALAAAASAAAGLFFAARSLVPSGAGWTPLALHGAAGVLGGLFGGAALVLAAATVLDAAVFVAAIARGRGVTDEQFRAFVLGEAKAGRLDPGIAGLIEVYRPQRRYRGLTFGLATSESIYLRPELAASPWLFRLVLMHELHHFNRNRERGPPRDAPLRAAWHYFLAEFGARAGELKGPRALKDAKLSTLERSLQQAQFSLRLDQPYDILVVNPSAEELKDPAVYRGLSGGRAKVETVVAPDPRQILSASPGRYRAVVVDRPFQALPQTGSPDAKRLEAALAQLETLHRLATRGVEASATEGDLGPDAAQFRDLARKARDVDRTSKKAVDAFERQIREYWREVAGAKLKDLPVNGWISGLYSSLQDKGFAFLPFGAADGGVTSWEKLLRYWQAEDGGRFQLVRVDLEDGGHVLLLRKTEARVGLWIKPLKGGSIKTSIPDADGTPERRAQARRALEEAGFSGQLARFDELGVKVSQIFGADVRRQEIFVTVPRRKAGAIRKFVTGSSIQVEPSEANFELHLPEAAGLQKVPAVWKLGFTGRGETAMIIDTGGDAAHADFGGRVETLDMVGDGPEDWIGHGTHVLGIVMSGDGLFTGMAKGAKAVVAKVFGRDSVGAADGPIMGSGAAGVQRLIKFFSLSFGSRGSSGDNLARFFSDLGENALVVASAGNSGPFDRTLSQPAAGVNVLAVSAAAKSLDDGRPEIAFYSSVGPDVDPRFGLPRARLKPELTAIGGDVTTRPDSPRAYEHGVGSAKSRHMPKGNDDASDGRHTYMSGTSMAAPMVTGIAMLVWQALKKTGLSDFVKDRFPLALKAVLMLTADDLHVPLWSQGAGLVNAEAAVKFMLQPGRDWGWLGRYEDVLDLEDQVYKAAELAKIETMARFEESEGDNETPAEGRQAVGDAAYAEMVKKFNAARQAALPKLLEALDEKKEPVWLIRMQAALTLLNFKSPESSLPLAQAALNDSDARVRRMAFLALAQVPTRDTDVLLQKASADPRWETGVYAAYALARRGDRAGVARLTAESANPDKSARQTAIWLLGQLGSQAEASDAEALSKIVAATSERGSLRHFAAASLANIAEEEPAAVSDRVVLDMLSAAGLQNLALTRTVAKFFPAALKSKALSERIKNGSLREPAKAFVIANRGAASKPGALGELVQMLARLLGISLDAPTPAPDKSGLGVAGVDGDMGPLDLIVRGPSALDDAFLSRFESRLAGTLPLSGSQWLSVPEHKLYALTVELRRRGFKVWRSRPMYPLAAGPRPDGVMEIDPAGALPALPEGPLPVLELRPQSGVSEARVVAALEKLYAAAGDPLARPAVLLLSLTSPPEKDPAAAPGRPLDRMVNRLVLSNVGVVTPAGDAGPAAGTLTPPADAGLSVVVTAAGPSGALEFYSSRAAPDRALISWAESVDAFDPEQEPAEGARVGTAAAARKSALKLRELAARIAKPGERLPDGYFLSLAGAVKQSAEPVSDARAHEVGAGLLPDAAKLEAAVDLKLGQPDEFSREAAGLISAARARFAPAAPAAPSAAPAGASWWKRFLRRLAAAPLIGLTISPVAADHWWKDPAAVRRTVTVPIYALRREKNDPGIGKFTDLGPSFRDSFAKEGVDTVLLTPYFATLDESPYAPVSPFALDEDYVDWSKVDEVSARPELAAKLVAPAQSVDYEALRRREGPVAREAYRLFEQEQLARDTPRAREFKAFVRDNAGWLTDYAEFMTLAALLGKPALDWAAEEVAQARRDPSFELRVSIHRYAQWIALGQLREGVEVVHQAGGKLLFDVPMFRGKNSVDAWKHPEYFTDLKTRNPGVENQWVHEDWRDLALWNWTRLKAEDYRYILAPYVYWLNAGFNGARVDALHFAYRFGNGQKASGDEPGDDYVRALAALLQSRGAFPLAEAFEGKAENVQKFGFVTVYGDWKKLSSPDDPRQPGFLPRLLQAVREPGSGRNASFVAYTLGDEWGDPFPVKEMSGGRSLWRYRIPLPSDPDYASRVRWDARPQLRALEAARQGSVWKEAPAVAAVLKAAAGSFIKHIAGVTEIWAASMDWFLEEWGRDTFVSLPGLLVSTGRFDEAKQNMRQFARYEHGGLIPNKVADGKGSDYNSVDGALWFMQAVKKYVEKTQDFAFAAEMLPVMRRIVAGYQKGTGYWRYGRYNKIYMDSDGLIASPAQATWMDADPEGRDRPVTPRNGKAVEINALWYSSLRFLARLEKKGGDARQAEADDALAERVKASFNEKFWFTTEENRAAWGGDGGALRDVIEGDPHGEAIRPNMIFAISHGEDLLSPERQRSVVLAATRDLLTPYGLRTLSPRDSFYRGRYDTSRPPLEKDLAYHQGTVWPWLIGAYVDSLVRVRRAEGWDPDRIRAEVAAAMAPLMGFMLSRPEGSLPEVFDGGGIIPALASFSLEDPSGLAGALAALATDQRPGGTRSQAWSVAEAVRALVEQSILAI